MQCALEGIKVLDLFSMKWFEKRFTVKWSSHDR